jgi:ketosteroid isomerase-like protein
MTHLAAVERVLARAPQEPAALRDGARVENDFWAAYTLRDGKIVRATHHGDRASALDAAQRA